MKLKMKKILFIVLSLIFVSSMSLYVACGYDFGKFADVGTVDEYEWSYSKEFVDEHDADMVIDGKLDEERWKHQHFLTFTENGVTMSYTTVFTDYGIYVGAKAQNDEIKWKGRFNFSGFWQDSSCNSAFGFKIQGAEVTEEHATTVFNFFIDAKNAASRNQTHFEAKSTTNGDVDAGEATEMTAELFVSWNALNIKIPNGKTQPDYVRIYPAYRDVVDLEKSANNKWLIPLFAEYGEARLLHRSRFDANGYINYDRPDEELGAVKLGNAANGIAKSDGWDLSEIANGVVSSDQYHGQAIFFKDVESDSYTYSVHIEITNESWGLNGHAGVCDMINSELFNAFYIDGTSVSNKLGGTIKFHTLNFFRDGQTKSNWHDTYEGAYEIPTDKNAKTDGIDITVIKQKERFFYFIYGDLVLCKDISKLSGSTCPGLYTLSRKAVFTDYQVTDYANGKNEDELKAQEKQLNDLIAESAFKVTVPGTADGGNIFADKIAVALTGTGETKIGAEDLTLEISPASGYVLKELTIKGTDIENAYQFFLANCGKDGKLVIPKDRINGDVNVTAEFAELLDIVENRKDLISLSGIVRKPDGTAASNVNVFIENENAALCYQTTTTSNGSYSFDLLKQGVSVEAFGFTADGEYVVCVDGTAAGYRYLREEVFVSASATGAIKKDIGLESLVIGGAVSLKTKTLTSQYEGWEYRNEQKDNFVVTTTKAPSGLSYFTATPCTDNYKAVLETTFINRTREGVNAEAEPGIGFVVNKGDHTIIFLLTGSRVTILPDGNWSNKVQTVKYEDMFNTRTDAEDTKYTIKLIQDKAEFILLIKQKYNGADIWQEIARYSDSAFKTECAYGLATTSSTGKDLLVEFTNYSILVGSEADAEITKLVNLDKAIIFNYPNGSQEIITVHENKMTSKPTSAYYGVTKDSNGFAVRCTVNGTKKAFDENGLADYIGMITVNYESDSQNMVYNESANRVETLGANTKDVSYIKCGATVSPTEGFEFSTTISLYRVFWPTLGVALEDENREVLGIYVHRKGLYYYRGKDASAEANVKLIKEVSSSTLRPFGKDSGYCSIAEGSCDLRVVYTPDDDMLKVYINGELFDERTLSSLSRAVGEDNVALSTTGEYGVYLHIWRCESYKKTQNGGYEERQDTFPPHAIYTNVRFSSDCTITINYPDGKKDVINKIKGALSQAPSKGYGYTITKNDVLYMANVNGNFVELSEKLLMSLVIDTEINYTEVAKNMTYNVDEARVETLGDNTKDISFIRLARTESNAVRDTVSADEGFDISVKINLYHVYWPATGITLEDEDGNAFMVIIDRGGIAYRYGKDAMTTDDKTSVDRISAGSPYGPSAGYLSIDSGLCMLRLIYKDGTLNVYVNGTLADTRVIEDSKIALKKTEKDADGNNVVKTIYAPFKATGDYKVFLYAWRVENYKANSSSGYETRDNSFPPHVTFTDFKWDSDCTITINYPDGTKDVITKINGALLQAPSKGYGYSAAYGGIKYLAFANGRSAELTEDFLLSLTSDTTVTFEPTVGGGKKLSVKTDSLTTVEFGKNGTGTVTTSPYITATEESFNTLSFVRLADTVSGEYTLSAHFDFYADSTITGFKVTDKNGNYLLFGFGSKNNRVLLGKNGVGNQGTTLQSSPSYVYSSVTAHNGKETVGGVDRWRYDYKITVYKNGAGDWAAKFLTRNTTKADIANDITTGWVDRTTFVLKDVINKYADTYFAYDDFDWEGTLTVDIMMLNNKKDGDKAIIEISQWSVDDKEG